MEVNGSKVKRAGEDYEGDFLGFRYAAWLYWGRRNHNSTFFATYAGMELMGFSANWFGLSFLQPSSYLYGDQGEPRGEAR